MSENTKKPKQSKRLSAEGCLIIGLTLIAILVSGIYCVVHNIPPEKPRPHGHIHPVISELESQIELYHAQCGKNPSCIEDLTGTFPASIDTNGDGIINNKDVFGPWINEVPVQEDGSPYKYNPKTGKVSQ